MGEILRAVLHQSAQWSRTKFYSGRLAIPAGLTPGQTRSTVTTFDTFGYFLLTSFYVGATAYGTLGSSGFGLTSVSSQIKLQDAQTGKYYYIPRPDFGGPPGNIVGSFASSQVELTEYPLFEPGERIRLIYTVPPFTVPTTENYVDICYSGIEYLISSGGAAPAASISGASANGPPAP